MSGEALKGHLDMLLLAAVQARPLHGYALIEELRRRSHGAFDLPEGTVYPALHRLEQAGLLESTWASDAAPSARLRADGPGPGGAGRARAGMGAVLARRRGRAGAGAGVIEAYLARLASQLGGDAAGRARILAEVRDHLTEATQAELSRGAPSGEEAARRAIARFGPPDLVARQFASVRQPWSARLRRLGAFARRRKPVADRAAETFRCSFCSKSQAQVRRLIAGPNFVYICSECVALCNEIIAREEGTPQPSPA